MNKLYYIKLKLLYNTKITLLFFYSQGYPHDKGLNLEECKNLTIEKAKNNVNDIIYYNISKLKNIGYDIKEYDNCGVVSANPYAESIGFYIWKPLIILLELEKINLNEILVYRDVNCIKYPQYQNYNNFKKNIIYLLNKCNFDFLITRENDEYTIEQFCKTNVIQELGDDHPFSYNFPLLIANIIIIKKTDISLILLKEWLEACKNEKWIDGNVYSHMSSKFNWHTPEQSILSIIIANWIRKKIYNIPLKYPNIILENREIDKIKIPNNYDYLNYIYESNNI
jgi:hypothetical protein